MYNKSPRFGVQYPTATPPAVGPYTYMLDDPLLPKRVNVVPFASTAKRKNSCAKEKSTDALYNVQRDLHIVGGHSLRNKSKRFVYKGSDSPPPGTYNPKLPGKIKLPEPGKGKIYLCKVPLGSSARAPSIPSRRDREGYDIDKFGRIIKMKEPTPCKPPGPSTYCIDLSSSTINNPYSGCRWSRRTSKRSNYEIIEGPGPARYPTEKATVCRRDAKEEEFREMARRFSYLPRFTEEQQCNALRDNYPPPGHYHIPPSFDFKEPITTVVKPFISRKPRFQSVQKENFVIYDVSKPLGCKPSTSMKGVPFGVGGKRFKKERKSDVEVDLIRIKSFVDEIIEKNCKKIGVFRAPFCSTSSRDVDFVPFDSHLKPDSAMYPREKLPPGFKIEQGHSVFRSTTGRTIMKLTEVPSVSKYDVNPPFKKIKDKISHNKKNLPFFATAQRKTVVLPHKNNPGPADYIGKQGIEKDGFFFNRSPRFKYTVSDTPPPDHYFIHPQYGESIYKAKDTFNLMCAEAVLRKKLRLAPKDTYDDYIQILKKKKHLRCYSSLLRKDSSYK